MTWALCRPFNQLPHIIVAQRQRTGALSDVYPDCGESYYTLRTTTIQFCQVKGPAGITCLGIWHLIHTKQLGVLDVFGLVFISQFPPCGLIKLGRKGDHREKKVRKR